MLDSKASHSLTHPLLPLTAGDVMGRLLASWPVPWQRLGWTPTRLAILLAARLALIPLMLLCVVGGGGGGPLLRGEGWGMAFMLLTALSGGYVGNVAMSTGAMTRSLLLPPLDLSSCAVTIGL